MDGFSLLDISSNKYVKVKELASILRVSPMTILREIERANLPAYRVGRLYRIRRSDAEAYIDARRHQG